jgi:hypothetical protein
MKKLLFLMLLVFTVITGYSQKQFREIYSELVLIDKGQTTSDTGVNTIFYNYANTNAIKVYLNKGSVMFFDKISSVERGQTEGGMTYSTAMYKSREDKFVVRVQLFDEDQYGVRFVFSKNKSLQFIP